MPKNFCERFIESCESHRDKVAMQIVGEPDSKVTFGEMLRKSRAIAYQLIQHGVEKGDRVAVIGENHPCWAISYLGCLYAGAICVPVDPHGERQTLSNFLIDSEAKIVFASDEFLPRLDKIEADLERTFPTVVWGSDASVNKSERNDFDRWASIEVPEAFAKEPPIATAEDNAVLIYTSGTTGKPKGVLLSHGNINAELDAIDGVKNGRLDVNILKGMGQ